MESAISRLGRRIRLGVVGGGGVALIGPVHRAAARLDDMMEVTAGVLSSNAERSVAEARRLMIPAGYPDLGAMLAGEGDRLDAVAIMTPNDSHGPLSLQALAAGRHVICDKPLTNDLAEARDLVDAVRHSGLVFGLTHNYSGYPMIRQARAMVRAGELGAIRLVHVVYAQGSLAARVEDEPEKMPPRLRWRIDPAKGGASHVMGDIGTHAHQLATYITGLEVERVLADVGAVVPGRTAHDTASLLLRLEGGARGVLWATKAATGAENAMSIEVYGEKGGLFWEHANANALRFMRNAEPATLLTRGLPGLHPLARHAARVPPGHPEGFHEGFGNLYRDFAEQVAAHLLGEKPDPLATTLPTVEEGARGLALIEAALRSTASGGWAEVERIG